jgi:hypothetical protein
MTEHGAIGAHIGGWCGRVNLGSLSLQTARGTMPDPLGICGGGEAAVKSSDREHGIRVVATEQTLPRVADA